MLDPIHYHHRVGDGGRGPGWAGPRARVPLGEAVGGFSAVCPPPQPFSGWLKFSVELKGKRKLDDLPRVPGREGVDDLSQTSASGQALCQVLHSS